MSLLEK